MSLEVCENITNIDPLSACAHLSRLILGGCTGSGVVDLAPLAACTGLKVLDLAQCHGITDFSPLMGCTQLLDLDATGLENLSSLGPVLVSVAEVSQTW